MNHFSGTPSTVGSQVVVQTFKNKGGFSFPEMEQPLPFPFWGPDPLFLIRKGFFFVSKLVVALWAIED